MRSLALALCFLTVPMVSGCGRRKPPAVVQADPHATPPAGERVGLDCSEPLTWHPEFGCLAEASNLDLWHRDRMGSAFVLVSADYSIDDQWVARFTAPPNDEPGEKDISIGRLRLSQGDHRLTLQAAFRGHGFGVFAYLQGYRFQVRSSHEFRQGPAGQVLAVVAYDKGGAGTPLEERPGVRFELSPAGLR